MDNKKTVDLLNEDIENEHAAIVQYLSHGCAMGEGELACEIEAIAREEMRHLDWLAETVVELGGVPSLIRGKMRTGGQAVSDWMGNDVLAEKDAIKLYREHIEVISDSKIERLLKRILSDEESHHGQFQHFIDKAGRKDAHDLRGTRDDKVSQALKWSLEHEYTVVLQYMLQSYLTKNRQVKDKLEDLAVNEMQHLGWLAEEMVGIGATPEIEHTEIDRSTETTDMLKVDIEIEEKVAVEYGRIANEIEDDDLKILFLRMRDHEKYHAEIFNDLLKDE